MAELSREREIEIADWIVDTCLTFGTSVETAYYVAAIFIQGLKGGERIPTVYPR